MNEIQFKKALREQELKLAGEYKNLLKKASPKTKPTITVDWSIYQEELDKVIDLQQKLADQKETAEQLIKDLLEELEEKEEHNMLLIARVEALQKSEKELRSQIRELEEEM